jgi:hypothetical protein
MLENKTDRIMFPIQTHNRNYKQGKIDKEIYMRAYEVYCAVYSPQEALIDLEGRNCRGGFGVDELIAFLYARAYPRSEWGARVDQCFNGGMENID